MQQVRDDFAMNSWLRFIRHKTASTKRLTRNGSQIYRENKYKTPGLSWRNKQFHAHSKEHISTQNKDGDARADTASLIKSSSKKLASYVDLGNGSLDMSLSNKQLYEIITMRQDDRMKQRFTNTSKLWQQQFHQNIKSIEKRQESNHMKAVAQEFDNFFKNGVISMSSIVQPLSIGDLVTIRQDDTEFYLVSDTPSDLRSNDFTFVNSNGRVLFAPSSIIKFRIPSVIPLDFHDIIKSFVMREPKTEYDPIGVPGNTHAGKDGEVDFLTSELTLRSAKTSDTDTYVVPQEARDLYAKHLVSLTINSMNRYKEYGDKLETLHRILQFTDKSIITKPRIVSIFHILHVLDTTDLPRLKSLTPEKFKQLQQTFVSKHKLDRIQEVEPSTHSISKYFALVMAIKKQNRLWKINEQNARTPVISLIVLPILNKVGKDELFLYLKQNFQTVVDNMVGRVKGIETTVDEKYYSATIDLMKDFITSNIKDFELESMVSSIIRQIALSLKLPNTYAHDYGKSKAYDILQLLEEVDYDDPALWATGLEYDKSVQSFQYFNYLHELENDNNKPETINQSLTPPDSEFCSKFSDFKFQTGDFFDQDPLKAQRTDFYHPIFCIDSPDAHEIDDGVSIHRDKDIYTVGIHIANPSSYIKPDSDISSMAFNKAFTSYFPEGPIKMLPDFISEKFGLVDEARTFTIEFDIPLGFQKMDEGDVYSFIKSNKRIKFYNAKNIPKDYTYDKVSEILKGQPDKYSNTIQLLYDVSKKLQAARISMGAKSFNYSRMKVVVNKNSNLSEGLVSDADNHQLTFNGITINLNLEKVLESHILVTELMIILNHLSSVLAQELNIPIIYRNQVMNLSPKVLKQIDQVSDSYQNMKYAFNFTNSAKLNVENVGHESLGLEAYSQITSPLRRYSDMINQWNFQSYFQNEPYIELSPLLSHLQTKELINKQLARVSERYWLGMFLKHYSKYGQIKLKVLINDLINDKYKTQIFGFDFNSFIEIDDTKPAEFKRDEIIDAIPDFRIIDFMENELLFTIK